MLDTWLDTWPVLELGLLWHRGAWGSGSSSNNEAEVRAVLCAQHQGCCDVLWVRAGAASAYLRMDLARKEPRGVDPA